MSQWLLVYVLLGVVGTWLARRYAIRQSLIDQPGERRSHEVATPRGGGIAIVIAALVAACALALHRPGDAPLLAAFGVGLVLVAAIGWLDDHRPLSPWWRLLVHAAAAALLALAVGDVYHSLWLGLVAFVAAMTLTNVWNFMDGINGLAASQAAMVAAGLAAIAGGSWGLLGVAVAAACVGFLPFNFPKARIFLGDVGSGSIGFCLAALVVVAGARLGARSWVVLLPLSVFLVDASLTLLRRLLRGERWWTPHTQHAYQVWARRVGHTRVTLAYAGATAAALVLTFWLASQPEMAFITGITLAWYICCAFLWVGLQKAGSFRAPTSI